MKRFECSAILFDLDGVLVDSAAYVEQQWRRWASARGLRPEPFLRVCHGRRALETIRMAAPQLDAEAEVRAFQPVEEAGAETIGPLAGSTRLLASLLYGVSPTDPTTLIVVSIIMLLIAVLASYVPAHRAMSVDPVEALRAD